MGRKGFSVTIDDKELNKQLENAIKRNPKKTIEVVHECLLGLAKESAKRAPVETGDLKNDCTATLNGITIFSNLTAAASIEGASLRAFGAVEYGLPYALRQHEDLSLQHDRTDGYRRKDGTTINMVAGGEAKYLERPFEERKNTYIKRIERIPEEVLK